MCVFLDLVAKLFPLNYNPELVGQAYKAHIICILITSINHIKSFIRWEMVGKKEKKTKYREIVEAAFRSLWQFAVSTKLITGIHSAIQMKVLCLFCFAVYCVVGKRRPINTSRRAVREIVNKSFLIVLDLFLSSFALKNSRLNQLCYV